MTVLPTRSSVKSSARVKPCASDDGSLACTSGSSRPTSPLPSGKGAASPAEESSLRAKGRAGESRKKDKEKRRTFDGASGLAAAGESRKKPDLLAGAGATERPHSAVPAVSADQRSRRRTTGSVKGAANPSTK